MLGVNQGSRSPASLLVAGAAAPSSHVDLAVCSCVICQVLLSFMKVLS